MTEFKLNPNQPHGAEPDPFTARVRRHLNTSLQSLDGPTLDRLATARREALAAARPNSAIHPGWLLPAGAMASIAVMVLSVGLLVNSTSTTIPNSTLDIELLSSIEHLDVFDNLDFYRWLAANDRAG